MRLIGLVVFLVVSVLAPLASEAQQAQVYRIGILSTANPRSTPFYQAFEQKLRALGYVEGQNIAFEYRDAEGKLERLPGLAAELVRLNVNVIIAATDPATRAAKRETTTIPILIVGINYDPVALGYVASLARPGANVTGVFFLFSELTAKRFGLFKEMLPTINRVAVASDLFAAAQLKTVEAANRSIGFKLQRLELRNPPDLAGAFRIATRSNADALFVLETPLIFRARKEIAQLALKNRLPTSFAFREYVDAGGLVSYGANFSNMFRRVAEGDRVATPSVPKPGGQTMSDHRVDGARPDRGFHRQQAGQQDGRRVLPRHRPGYRRRCDRGLAIQPVRHARGHRVERLQPHRGRHLSCGVLGGLPRDSTHCVIPTRTFYTTGMEHSPTSATGTGWERTPWRAVQSAAWMVLLHK